MASGVFSSTLGRQDNVASGIETFLPFEEWERNGRRWRTNRKVEHPGEHSVPSVVGETTMAEFRRSDFVNGRPSLAPTPLCLASF
ncbi:hypothetical protein HZH66_008931 [Vespula vulgaris]|uniref:Uncharacterized protein n=2 Tax=Vespula TaxID=7451 RepID=A0A834U770_VESPE|nr:hypothetical protein HZH66_008931 [Vespula vulgaris]KAF7419814.1 hypothetical protein H0235_010111 [Vespula pensylvanica]